MLLSVVTPCMIPESVRCHLLSSCHTNCFAGAYAAYVRSLQIQMPGGSAASRLGAFNAYPAVHRPGLPGDIRRRRGGQEHRRVPHLFETAHPSEWDGLDGGSIALLVGLGRHLLRVG